MTKRLDVASDGTASYFGMTKSEWDAAVANMRPPTPDDCTITATGERIDTKEKMLAHLDEELDKRATAASIEVAGDLS